MKSGKYKDRKLAKRLISIEFVCHGNILKSPGKASKINGFIKQSSAYYTTTTPFEFRSEP